MLCAFALFVSSWIRQIVSRNAATFLLFLRLPFHQSDLRTVTTSNESLWILLVYLLFSDKIPCYSGPLRLTVVGAQLVQFKRLTKCIAGVLRIGGRDVRGSLARMRKSLIAYNILISKPEWEASHRWEDAIKMGFQLIGCTLRSSVRPMWTR
jgi:hypothetical protein